MSYLAPSTLLEYLYYSITILSAREFTILIFSHYKPGIDVAIPVCNGWRLFDVL